MSPDDIILHKKSFKQIFRKETPWVPYTMKSYEGEDMMIWKLGGHPNLIHQLARNDSTFFHQRWEKRIVVSKFTSGRKLIEPTWGCQ